MWFTAEKNLFGEEQKVDQLIVMDNVLGLADKPNAFTSFIKVFPENLITAVFISFTLLTRTSQYEN